MRAREFLKLITEQAEVAGSDPLSSLKAIIASKIKELPPTKETQKLLAEIEDILTHVGAGGKLGLINQELAQIDDPSVKKAQKLLGKYILSLDMSKQERDDLFSRWKNDRLIDRKKLLSPGRNSITDIVLGYDQNPAIKELTDDLAQVAALGQGKGEFLLSVFSKNIFKMQKGDLQIDGKQIEVKTLDAGGGRFYDQEVRPASGFAASVENFKNTWAADIRAVFPKLASTGLKLIDMMTLGEHVDASKKEAYYASVNNVLTNIFPGMDVGPIIDAMKVGNIGAAKQSYAVINLDFYRGIKKDDYGILFIDLTTSPSTLVFFKDAAELAQGGLRLHADTVYPVTGDPRNAYPQMRIIPTKAGVSAGETPTPTAAPKAKKSAVKPAPQPAPVAPAPKAVPAMRAAKKPATTPGIQNQNFKLAASKVPMGQDSSSQI